jgi:GH15 family glucan-1,4-alpha-glucosidase
LGGAGVYGFVPTGTMNEQKHIATMKKLLLVILTLGFAGSLALNAADAPKKKQWTEDQKKLQKEMVEKYDTNKDGKLDKEERSKISAEDKKKMQDAGIMGGGQKKKAE